MSGKAAHRGWGWLRRRASGRWQASYVGPDGRRYFAPATFDTKMEAEEWLSREKRGIAQARNNFDVWLSPADRQAAMNAVERETLAVYGARWIEQRDLAHTTRRHYEYLFGTYILGGIGGLGDLRMDALKSGIVRDWYAKTLRDKPTVRAHTYGLLRSICNTAVKDEILERNPCQIDGAGVTSRRRELVIPEIEDVAVIAAKIDPRYKALVLLCAWCACRFGEVSELRRRDLSEDCAVLTIERGVTHHGGCVISRPKSGKSRKVVVPPHIRADLQWHLDTHVDGISEESLLFAAPRKGVCHVSNRQVLTAFQRACATAGLDGVRLHDLRHFAGHQTARVANLPETMGRLGHTTVNASLIYQGVVSGRDVEIAEALSGLAVSKRGEV